MHKRGEIVLVPVPFSDLSSTKRRPVVVMSCDEYNGKSDDLICMAITSQIRGLDHEILINSTDMDEGALPKESCIRADKIYTLNKGIVVKKFGKLTDRKVAEAAEAIRWLLS